MLHGDKIGRIIRPGIVVPSYHVQILRHSKLIQLLDETGHIGLDRYLRIIALQHPVFVQKTLRRGVCDEPHVVKLYGGIEPVVIIELRRQGHLLKIRENPAPKRSMPSFVQLLQGTVAPPQPQTELCLAVGAIAVGSVFVGHMPHGQGRVMCVALCHFLRNGCRTLPVF